MHTLTLNFTSVTELLEFTSRFNPPITTIHSAAPIRLPDAELSGGVEREVPAAMEAAPKPARKAKVKIEEQAAPVAEGAAEKKPVDVATEKVSIESTTATSPDAAATTLDLKKDVRPHALALMKADRAALLELFDKFGVTNLDELAVKQLPDFLAAIKAELEGKE